MKKILGSLLNILLITLTLSTIFLAMNTNIQTSLSESHENTSHLSVKQINLEELDFFDISEFTNTSHSIQISRVIAANRYGYTTSQTEIRLFNNASKPINAFNYTIPTEEFNDTKYMKIYTSTNETPSESAEWYEIEKNNKTVDLVVKIPSVEVGQSITIYILMDHPNAITFDEDAQLVPETFPYHFNLSFLPLVSFPITSFELKWLVGKDSLGEVIEVALDNETIQPTSEFFNGNYSQSVGEILFQNITELTTVNRSLLNNSEYGYNLTNLVNLAFIPAYSSNLALNLTSFLSFDYFQNKGTKIEFTSLKTIVSVSEWGQVTTKHEISIRNIGIKSGTGLSSALGGSVYPIIEFSVPETAYKIGMYDNYGNITPTVTPDPTTGRNLVVFEPRVQIEHGDIYDVFLSYQEKGSDIIKVIGSGKLQLKIPISMNFNWTVRQFDFNLLLPFGSSFSSNTIINRTEHGMNRKSNYNSSITQTQLLGIFNKPGTKIIFENLTPLSNTYVNIDFGITPFFPVFNPLSISLLFLALGIIYTVIRNISFGFKPKRISIEEIPIDLIRRFVKSYEEKTAIREQILRLDRKRKSKNISAREYEKTRIILNNRQQRTDRAIVNVSQKLAEEGQRYRIAMRKIEVA
ncbi:MAG: hypothetical protein ACFE95_05765, partial [Candidatus Hodarchaeota archaeon]